MLHFHKVLRSRREAEKHVQAVVRKSSLLQDDIQWHQKSCEALKQGLVEVEFFPIISRKSCSTWSKTRCVPQPKDIESLVCTNSKLKRSLRDEETEIAREKRFVKMHEMWLLKRNTKAWLTGWQFFVYLHKYSGYEEYRKKMFKHRELSALEENSNDIDVDIAEKTKYRETLEKECTYVL